MDFVIEKEFYNKFDSTLIACWDILLSLIKFEAYNHLGAEGLLKH